MIIFKLSAGDRNPPIRRYINSWETGLPLDFPGSRVYFSMVNSNGVRVVDRAAGVMGVDSRGRHRIVTYQWAAGDTETPGNYRGQFRVFPASGRPFSVPPGNEYMRITIGKRLVAVSTTTSTTTTTTTTT
jgi:hypothetical protein